ncbi:MAG: translation initiation factor IF-2, partial [Candidatus Omnitrophica bacterium]|nr:translation initiation factor IF-2 [Candidatus Omnitrophota bacterium]
MTKEKKEKSKAKKSAPAKVKKTAHKVTKPKAVTKPKVVAKHKAVSAQPKVIKPAAAVVKHKTVKIKEAIIPMAPQKPSVAPAPIPVVHVITPEPVKKHAAAVAPKPETPASKPRVEVVLPPPPPPPPTPALKDLELELPITVKDLAIRLQEKPSVIIKTLMGMRIMVGINNTLEEEVATTICQKYGCKIKKAPGKEEIILSAHQDSSTPEQMRPRSPIVTFMGHVDHGKTSLLDAIRKTKVAESEHGGITQHIGASQVSLPHGEITFLDTPGHEAFTAMRARGASVTDIVVLVVAADDGIMPQTEEAIDHAKAAGVPIIVALNKVDKPTADVDRVKKQLAKFDLTAEDWGGKTIMVPVSAKTGQGIDNLLEMILLEAQMLELKADPNRLSRGIVIEAKMAKGRGPVATLLVQNGTLHLNENIILGNWYGKIRAMFDGRGHSVTAAKPSMAVEVLGIQGVPEAGEQFFAIQDEKQAKELSQMRLEKEKQQQMKSVKRISLEELHAAIQEGKIKELKMIIKADVQGSLEAIKDTLDKLQVSEIKLVMIHMGVGTINSSDVILAVASDALILGFNVDSDERAKELIAKEGVEVRTYHIIYELANDIKQAVEGMLEPKLKKTFLGRVDIRKVFKLSTAGVIAGCFVTKGKINRNSQVSLVRNGQTV